MSNRDDKEPADNGLDAVSSIFDRSIADQTDNAETEIEKVFSKPVKPDGHLQAMIKVCNQLGGAEFPITIFTGGNWIDGYMVAAKKYFEQWAADLANGIPGLSETERDDYRTRYAEIARLLGEQSTTSDNPRYFHLHKIRSATGNSQVFLPEAKIFRFRADSVISWSLGIMSLD